ncbi:hypothetical protein C9374_003818 [Naegleria lovaniensis]|uniref:Transmembrane protein n=1 Tax=Naegleria lovaniensis TaxID=51637 RepID=A0AA88H609_NAELO|nr:uncharacterized protein C9374_003818 [Naegleria lovaniensis]KAG2394054.1 hypothetical protein C9374_003818 [Naegleria lovaniensis]
MSSSTTTTTTTTLMTQPPSSPTTKNNGGTMPDTMTPTLSPKLYGSPLPSTKVVPFATIHSSTEKIGTSSELYLPSLQQRPSRYVQYLQQSVIRFMFALITLFTIACICLGRFTMAQGLLFEFVVCVGMLMMDPYVMMQRRWRREMSHQLPSPKQ